MVTNQVNKDRDGCLETSGLNGVVLQLRRFVDESSAHI
jgi:hypothetical protein